MNDNEIKLKKAMSDVFGIEESMIGENTSVDSTEGWDSFKHLNLVLILESEFDITFADEETVQILSYPLIKIVLEEHGIDFN